MTILRCFKNNEIFDSNEKTRDIRDKTIFNSAVNQKSKISINKKCAKVFDSYHERFNLTKGHNLVRTECDLSINSLPPAIQGRINEANFIRANFDAENNIGIILPQSRSAFVDPSRNLENHEFQYTADNSFNILGPYDPLDPPWNKGFPLDKFTRFE